MKRYKELPVTSIELVDIPAGEEKVKIITELSRRMIYARQLPINISYTLNRRTALENADFVITQIRVGGLEARVKDEKIPLQHNLIGQETNGAGGIFKAFRTIPVLLDIASDIHDVCPDAWLLNFTNPAGIVTEAVLKHSNHKKVIGICNIPYNMRAGVAEVFDVAVDNVMIEFAGLNHFVFGKQVWIHGENKTEETVQRLLHRTMDYSPANIVSQSWTPVFLEALNMLPNPYHQYYFQYEESLKKAVELFVEEGTRAEMVQKVEETLFETYQDTSLQHKPEELDQRGGAYYSEAACSIIASMHNHSMDVQTVNTLNRGAISDLPDDSVIEVNCVITKAGPRPLAIGALPQMISAPIIQLKKCEELVIKAAITGDYHTAYAAMITNPLIPSEEKANVLLGELLNAHKSFLPQFFENEVKI